VAIPNAQSSGATWVIGDVHGCADALRRLLDAVYALDSTPDLVFCGDLVNRGPADLETLQLVLSLGARTVLGNHDLLLLAIWFGVRRGRRGDTVSELAEEPGCEALVEWLISQPFAIETPHDIITHAGLHPSWSDSEAIARSRQVSRALQRSPEAVLRSSWEFRGDPWDESAGGSRRTGDDLAMFTRARCLSETGAIDASHKGTPDTCPFGLVPWYALPHPRKLRVVFGHWAAHGVGPVAGAYCIDGACVWGGDLVAIRLQDDVEVRVGASP
jgi:bis(5'-nucleosyl)-tetraphosphatase (symmetrical)